MLSLLRVLSLATLLSLTIGLAACSETGPSATETPAPSPTSASVPARSPDRPSLVALYNATDGPQWTNGENWLSDRPIGSWYGVTTDSEGRVTRLILNGNNLAGPLPDRLGNLSHLTELDLADNILEGPIPEKIGNLGGLTRLRLSNNSLTGQIPGSLGNLDSLGELSLSDNGLAGQIPNELGELGNLRELRLFNNNLTGCVPRALQEVADSDLDEVGLRLCGVDREALVALYEATGGPYWKDNSHWLSDAPIESWYGVDVDSHGRVSKISLPENNLTGALPPQLGSLSGLTSLYIFRDNLTGPIPNELGRLRNLEWLYLDNNDLTGPIPPELSSLPKLEWMFLRENDLTGCIPETLRKLPGNDLGDLGLPSC